MKTETCYRRSKIASTRAGSRSRNVHFTGKLKTETFGRKSQVHAQDRNYTRSRNVHFTGKIKTETCGRTSQVHAQVRKCRRSRNVHFTGKTQWKHRLLAKKGNYTRRFATTHKVETSIFTGKIQWKQRLVAEDHNYTRSRNVHFHW